MLNPRKPEVAKPPGKEPAAGEEQAGKKAEKGGGS